MSDYHRTYCAGCGDWHTFENGACMECKQVPGRVEQEISSDMERVRLMAKSMDFFYPGLKGGSYAS